MSSEKWLLLSIALERPFFSAGDPAGRREVIMGLFDKIVSMVGDNISGGTENKGLLQRAVSLIASPEVGGLGDVAGSWVGKGANLPVSGEQVINALGSDKIREIASNLL
jgi:uncharacterized protein YidB (DUF937 family)